MDFELSKTKKYMNILSYYHVKVNIKALSAFFIHKGYFSFDFLINTPYFIKL